jgi:predicted ArsR family transcriptional regulator
VNTPSNKGRTIMKMSAILQAHLIKMLCDGPCTIQEIADETGLHYMTVQVYLRELYKAGAAHIAAWEKDSRGRDVVKVYALGPGNDAKRRKMTAAERQAACRARRLERTALHALAQPSLSASSSTCGL